MLRLQHQIYYKEKGNVFANVAFTTALTTRPPHVTAVQYSVQQCVKASFLQFGILVALSGFVLSSRCHKTEFRNTQWAKLVSLIATLSLIRRCKRQQRLIPVWSHNGLVVYLAVYLVFWPFAAHVPIFPDPDCLALAVSSRFITARHQYINRVVCWCWVLFSARSFQSRSSMTQRTKMKSVLTAV